MKTRTKTKSTKVPDEVLTTAPLQKALSSTEGLQKCKTLACKAEKKARKHDSRMVITYWENVNLIYQILQEEKLL